MSGSYPTEKVFGRLIEPATWFWIALNLLGSTTEALVTTLGLFAIAARALAMDVWGALSRGLRSNDAQTAISLSLLFGSGVALLMSAVFFVPPERPDQIAYGRYALPALVPMVAIGLLRLSLPRAQRLRDFGLAITITLVCVALMGYAFTRLPSTQIFPWNYINAPCLFLAQHFILTQNAWTAIGLYFAILGGAVAVVAWRSGSIGVLMFASINVLTAAVAWSAIALPQSRYYEGERHLQDVANAFESTTGEPLCLTMSRGLDPWHAIDMRWRLFPKMAPLTGRNSAPCVHGMIDPVTGPDPLRYGMRLIATEHSPSNGLVVAGLFVEPGPALEKWEQSNSLPALDSLGPLPQSEWHAEIELSDPASIPKRIKVDTAFTVTVTVRHGGISSRWTPMQEGPYPIRLGARVTRAGTDLAIGEYRVWFAKELKAGESRTETIQIGPISEPGLYRATIGVLQESVAWFSGAREIEFEVESP